MCVARTAAPLPKRPLLLGARRVLALQARGQRPPPLLRAQRWIGAVVGRPLAPLRVHRHRKSCSPLTRAHGPARMTDCRFHCRWCCCRLLSEKCDGKKRPNVADLAGGARRASYLMSAYCCSYFNFVFSTVDRCTLLTVGSVGTCLFRCGSHRTQMESRQRSEPLKGSGKNEASRYVLGGEHEVAQQKHKYLAC